VPGSARGADPGVSTWTAQGRRVVPLGIGRWGAAKVGLARQRRLELVNQAQPLAARAGSKITQRADDLLSGSLGRKDTLDEEVVKVGFSVVTPRGFADVHTCRHY
jgi:hypothetical protein